MAMAAPASNSFVAPPSIFEGCVAVEELVNVTASKCGVNNSRRASGEIAGAVVGACPLRRP